MWPRGGHEGWDREHVAVRMSPHVRGAVRGTVREREEGGRGVIGGQGSHATLMRR